MSDLAAQPDPIPKDPFIEFYNHVTEGIWVEQTVADKAVAKFREICGTLGDDKVFSDDEIMEVYDALLAGIDGECAVFGRLTSEVPSILNSIAQRTNGLFSMRPEGTRLGALILLAKWMQGGNCQPLTHTSEEEKCRLAIYIAAAARVVLKELFPDFQPPSHLPGEPAREPVVMRAG